MNTIETERERLITVLKWRRHQMNNKLLIDMLNAGSDRADRERDCQCSRA